MNANNITTEIKFQLGDIVVMVADGPNGCQRLRVNYDNAESDIYASVVYFAADGFKRDTFHQDLLLFV